MKDRNQNKQETKKETLSNKGVAKKVSKYNNLLRRIKRTLCP
jgi:hypothetical protein